MAEQTNARSTDRLSWSTIQTAVRELRAFFLWLTGRPGYDTKIYYHDADYLKLSEKELSVTRGQREKRVPTLEQMHHVLSAMPTATDQERRNRALVPFAVLAGARADARASFKLKHVDLERHAVVQDAHENGDQISQHLNNHVFLWGARPYVQARS